MLRSVSVSNDSSRMNKKNANQHKWRKKTNRKKVLYLDYYKILCSLHKTHEFSIDVQLFIFWINKTAWTTSNYLARTRLDLFDMPCCFAFSNDLIFIVLCWRKHNDNKSVIDKPKLVIFWNEMQMLIQVGMLYRCPSQIKMVTYYIYTVDSTVHYFKSSHRLMKLSENLRRSYRFRAD